MTKRSWIILISVVVGVILIAVAGFGVALVIAVSRLGGGDGDWEEHQLRGEGFDKVAVVNITGEIHGGGSAPGLFGDGGAGAADIVDQLHQAAEDDDVHAVILRIDSPGGAVVASDDIARAVRRLDASKPVVASMGDMAASGGYYVASQTRTIVANPGTITGSIGVIAVLFNLEGTAQKLGAKPIVLKSGELKDAGSPFREFTDADRRVYQRLLDQSYDQFVDTVAEGRGMSAKKVRRIADGRPLSGAEAMKNGLVDEFGDLEDAYGVALDLADLDADDARLVEYRASRGLGLGFPFGFSGTIDEVKRELGFEPGLKYLFVP